MKNKIGLISLLLLFSLIACSHKGQNVSSLTIPPGENKNVGAPPTPVTGNENTQPGGPSGEPRGVHGDPPHCEAMDIYTTTGKCKMVLPPVPEQKPPSGYLKNESMKNESMKVDVQVTPSKIRLASQQLEPGYAPQTVDVSKDLTPIVLVPAETTKLVFNVKASSPDQTGPLTYILNFGSMQLESNSTGSFNVDIKSISFAPGGVLGFTLQINEGPQGQTLLWSHVIPIQIGNAQSSALNQNDISVAVQLDSIEKIKLDSETNLTESQLLGSKMVNVNPVAVHAVNVPSTTNQLKFTVGVYYPQQQGPLTYILITNGKKPTTSETGILDTGPLPILFTAGSNLTFKLEIKEKPLDQKPLWSRNITVEKATSPGDIIEESPSIIPSDYDSLP